MGIFAALFSPLGRAISRSPYVCVLICAAIAALSALVHWGHMLAFFVCAASMIVMWKDEMNHPVAVTEDPAGLA